MNTATKALSRAAVSTVALAVAAAGMLATATAANAAVGPDQEGAPTSGSLTINKWDGIPDGTTSDHNPLDGVEFTVTPVGVLDGDVCEPIDLTDPWPTGLDGLFASAPNAPISPFCLLPELDPVSTDDNGQAVFSSLPLSVYFVQETDPGDHAIVATVPDFYVSIPTSNGASGNGWNYDVVADPKNQLIGAPTKIIEPNPSGLVIGSNVTWEITVPIPDLAEGDAFDQARVYDKLDGRLTYVSSTVTVDGEPLVEDTDYTVDQGGVSWSFTAAGLMKLDAAQASDIVVNFDTRVVSVGDGNIDNPGGTPDNGYGSEFNNVTHPGVPTPFTYWGQLAIEKIDDSATPVALQGAQFKVFEPNVGGACEASAPATGEIATGVSNAAGVVEWAGVTPNTVLGLWIANSNTALTAPEIDYCVYETIAPAGHTANPAGSLVTITPGETNVNELTVVNPKTQGPNLPLTGAQGTMLLTVAGLLLVAGGAAAVTITKRRRQTAE